MGKIAELDGTVASGDWISAAVRKTERTFVHGNLALLDIILTQADQDCVLSALSSNWTISNDREHLSSAGHPPITVSPLTKRQQQSKEHHSSSHLKRPSASIVFG